MTGGNRDRPPCDGYILVAVLGVMLLLTGFIAAGSLLVRSMLDTARVEDAQAPMSGLALGGLEMTVHQLFVMKAAPVAIDGHRIRLGEGSFTPEIHDEASKADLNGSDPKLLVAIFQIAGLDSRTANDLLAYVVETRGPDRASPAFDSSSTNSPPSGAASPQAQPGAKANPRGFQSVNQLKDFADLRRSDWQALRPFLTVFNPDGKVNVLSANSEVLSAIPGLSSADVKEILARRDGAAKNDIENLLSARIASKAYLKATYGPAYTIRIDAVLATGRRKAINAVVAASQSPNDPYDVLDWWE